MYQPCKYQKITLDREPFERNYSNGRQPLRLASSLVNARTHEIRLNEYKFNVKLTLDIVETD